MGYVRDTPRMTLARCRTQGQDILERVSRIKKKLGDNTPFDLYGIEFDAQRILEVTDLALYKEKVKVPTFLDQALNEGDGVYRP